MFMALILIGTKFNIIKAEITFALSDVTLRNVGQGNRLAMGFVDLMRQFGVDVRGQWIYLACVS